MNPIDWVSLGNIGWVPTLTGHCAIHFPRVLSLNSQYCDAGVVILICQTRKLRFIKSLAKAPQIVVLPVWNLCFSGKGRDSR